MKLDELKPLLELLNAHSVAYYKSGALELTFHVEQTLEPRPATKDHTIEVPIDESTLPPDLRSDTLMNMDAVMNWSSPQGDASHLPLTDNEELA